MFFVQEKDEVSSNKNEQDFEQSIEEYIYNVEKILQHFTDRKTGKTYFRVKWEGYSKEFNTWEEEHDFKEGNIKLSQYKKKHNL